MGKKRQKYKDVVKSKHKQNGKYRKVVKSANRKPYATHKKGFKSRKFTDKPKIEKETITNPEVDEESSMASSYESEDDDKLKQLLGTFKFTNKKTDAIESDDSDEDDDDKNPLDENMEVNDTDDETGSNVDMDSSSNSIHSDQEQGLDEVNELDVEVDEPSDSDHLNDPFVLHNIYDIHDELLNSLQSRPIKYDVFEQTWPHLGKLMIEIPQCDKHNLNENKLTLSEDKIYAPLGAPPKKLGIKTSVSDKIHIKSQINCNITKSNPFASNTGQMFSPLQGEIFSVLNNYQDLYFTKRTLDNAEEVRFVYCLHALNHIIKTRLKVLHHNAKLSKTQKQDVPEDFRDQGLVRPKVLMILPFKDSVNKTVQMLIDLLISDDKGNVINKNRFIEEYTGNELAFPKHNQKPEDYEKTFSGNVSDDFKIGISVTKKCLKLYSDFYSSDIIIASPLGLRTIIGAEGEPDRDYDFLASIELLIFDQTELFLMQNWDHVIHILNNMHLQPKKSHGTDFSRVRTWSLNGWAKYYRQTIIISSLVLPEINAILNKHCINYAGKVKTITDVECGSIRQVFVQLPHVFHKLEVTSVADAIDSRYEFFINHILPQQKDNLMKQTLIFIPTYFDYVKIRNYFKREDLKFVQICEYTKKEKIARARDMFYHGDAHFMLYTERYHFFNRIRVKGIRHIVFYQLPTFPHFYYEICNLMQEGNMNKKIGNMSNMSVTVIYSKYDVHQLSAVIGTSKAAKLIQSNRKIHMMVTGSN